MSGKLNTTVFVHRDGESKAFGPGDTVPDWASDLITNTEVWSTPPTKRAEKTADEGTGAGAGGGPETPTGGTAGGGADGTGDSGDQTPAPDAVPPKAGKGSGATAWAAYAKAKGFEVDADAKASEIIDALADAGIPTE